MDSYISNKIAIFHSVGIVFVMLHHCGFRDLSNATNIYIGCISNYSLWAICMYFALSGYLFFYGYDKDDLWEFIKHKYFRRFYSLLLPLVAWSLIGTCLYICLYRFGARDEWTLLAHDIYKDGILRLFINPGMLQMWFIRDLIICQLFAIPLYYCIYYLRFFSIVIILAVSYLCGGFIFGGINFSYSSLFYFSIGACFSICNWSIDSRKLSIWISLISFILTYLAFVLQSFIPYPNPLFMQPLTALFFVSVWLLYDHFPLFFNKVEQIFSLRKTHFFMFATFEPFYFIFKSGTISLLASSFINSSLLQITILTLLYIGTFYFLNRQALFIYNKFPKVYNVLTGKR